MKLRTLYDCRNHWQWLWITGSSTKLSYKPSKKWEASYAWGRFCLSAKNSLFRKWQKARSKKRETILCPQNGTSM